MFDAKNAIKELLEKEQFSFDDLCTLVSVLRSPDGCPWDREQTNKSLRNAFIDETYEFIEGLDLEDNYLMCEELGDVLFQIIFHADIKKNDGVFKIDDVIDGICKKMILRHPHVFGDVNVANSGEVLVNWENIKNDEKQRKTPFMQLDSISKSLPSLMRAQKLQKKADKTSLRKMPDNSELISQARKLLEDIEKNGGDNDKIGKLLFACAGLSLNCDIESEEALSYENDKFLASFNNDEQ